MALQKHVWSTFDLSEIGSELSYNDLQIVWLKRWNSQPLSCPHVHWRLKKLNPRENDPLSPIIHLEQPTTRNSHPLGMVSELPQKAPRAPKGPKGPERPLGSLGPEALRADGQNAARVGLSTLRKYVASNKPAAYKACHQGSAVLPRSGPESADPLGLGV